MNREALVTRIESAASAILAGSPGAVVKNRLLREVLGRPPDDPAMVEAARGLAESHWVRELGAEQWVDGGWGAFHSQNTRRKQAILTTEVGVERALALGLDGSHPILIKARNYLLDILAGRIPFPDRAEKNNRWATGARLFTAATLARIAPQHPALEQDRQLWGEIARWTFHSGGYNEDDETRAHAALTGASVKGTYLRLRGRYQLTLLGTIQAGLPPGLEQSLLAWLWARPDGIGYLTVPLDLPPPAQSGEIDRWLASHELLSQYFPAWTNFAVGVVNWLLTQQQANGYWDFGPCPQSLIYLPLSDSWQNRLSRQFDWTVRVLALLKRYTQQTSGCAEPDQLN